MNLFSVPAGRTAKWVVFLVTLVVFGGFAAQAGKFEQAQKNETSSFLPASAESVKALKLIERFPGGEEAPAVIVFERRSGLTGADKRRIQDTVAKLNADATAPPRPSERTMGDWSCSTPAPERRAH